MNVVSFALKVTREWSLRLGFLLKRIYLLRGKLIHLVVDQFTTKLNYECLCIHTRYLKTDFR